MARGGSTPRPRHVPQRTCVACRQGKAKRELVRIVRTVDGSVRVDPTGKASGRGAYLCDQPGCWADGLRRGILTRALKLEAIAPADLTMLSEQAERLTPSQATVS